MRKHLWKAVTIAAVLVMMVSAVAVLAQEKKSKPAPAGKTSEQKVQGCGMKGETGKGMPACGTKGGTGKGETGCCAGCCCKHGDGKCCGAKGRMGGGRDGCCRHGDANCCGPKGGMGGGMRGCGMKGEMGGGMPGCGMRGGMGMAAGPMGGPGMRPGMGDGPGRMRLLQGLDLTAEQHKKLADIDERQERLAVQAQADLRLATMDLQKLMRADAPDKAQIDAQIDKVAQLRTAMEKSRIAALLEVRALLTPDQLKKWQAGPMGEEGE